MDAIKIQGNYSRPQAYRAGVRIKVLADTVRAGDVITAMTWDQARGNVATAYRVTGVGAAWIERGYVIDEEDARSFGGLGERIVVGSPGRVQYAYAVPA